jgi:DNA-binding CsgD family transcriptional regulator/PAS domain-containing protein
MRRPAINGLVEHLYAMPQVGSDWRPFLSALGNAFRSHAVALHSHDVMHQQGLIDTSVGVDEHLAQRFKDLAHEHPWYVHGGDRLLNTGMADDRGLLPEAVLYGSRFYGEILKPMRIDHGLAVVLRHDGPASMTVLSINRDCQGGYFKASERELARSLLPHLRAAYLLQQRLGWLETLSITFRAALDRLEDGVVILDRRGVIQFANTSAERFAAQTIYTRRADGRLCLPTRAQSSCLHGYVAMADVDPQPLLMRVQDQRGLWIATLKACPVDRVANIQWGESGAGVMLFFTPMQARVAPDRRATWERLWGFTRAEAVLAVHLADGSSLDEAADSLGVSINTVRTQVRALYAKTGTRRQPELIRALLVHRA